MDQNSYLKTAEQDRRIKENMSKIKHVFLVMSGKGGVGKTTVAVNLAYSLSLAGNTVGIMDIDLHGPNIAKMLGMEGKTFYKPDAQSEIEPVEVAKNLKAVSLAFTGYTTDQPIIWRGPMKTAVIKQFLSDVHWGELDYLVVDAPPGTGDEPLSICQFIPDKTGAIIVTTPQDVAVLDARKSVHFAQEMRIPVIGVIENMSGFFARIVARKWIYLKKEAVKKPREIWPCLILGAFLLMCAVLKQETKENLLLPF